MDLPIPKDAFSDGQVRSKLWLSYCLNLWALKHINQPSSFSLTWYGSWVGVGPLLLLSLSDIAFHEVNLLEIDKSALDISEHLLNYWSCKGLRINRILEDMNQFRLSENNNHLVINTACEHVNDLQWLTNIPKNSMVLLQSTDMAHIEHVNCSSSLQHFKDQVSTHLSILETDQLDFVYPNSAFSRFMIFGLKK